MATRYEEFLQKNCPAAVAVPWGEVEAAAGQLGCAIAESPFQARGGEVRFAIGESYLDLVKADTVELAYGPGCREQSVAYRARIAHYSGAGYHADSPNVEELLTRELAARFAPEVTVSLPERVVVLPVPGWVRVVGDDPWSSAAAPAMFESEARASLETFIGLAKAALQKE